MWRTLTSNFKSNEAHPIKVDIPKLIKFYDEDSSVQLHSNAFKTLAGEELGFALLMEYFKRQNRKVECLSGPCTTGNRKGPRLDAWLKANGDNGEVVYYQVEVKSWSFHGVGKNNSKKLKYKCTQARLAEFKQEEWQRYWADGQFKQPTLNKVLRRMKPPSRDATVKPLACIWTAVHPKGEATPFFEVATAEHQHFDSVCVFSMSGFLRGLGQEYLELAGC